MRICLILNYLGQGAWLLTHCHDKTLAVMNGSNSIFIRKLNIANCFHFFSLFSFLVFLTKSHNHENIDCDIPYSIFDRAHKRLKCIGLFRSV